jgi:hypothetical protein
MTVSGGFQAGHFLGGSHFGFRPLYAFLQRQLHDAWSRIPGVVVAFSLVIFCLMFGHAVSPAEAEVRYQIWPSSIVPANPAVNVGEPGEVGVKFRSQLPGYITGVRFYKGAANTGTHVGNLWTVTGTHLASATFTNETASGWQEVLFPSPVPITANTTYVASYHINSGYVAFDESYFVDGVYNNPLRALRNGEDGPNGLFKLGTSGFPTLSWQSTNYWVDVVFRP